MLNPADIIKPNFYGQVLVLSKDIFGKEYSGDIVLNLELETIHYILCPIMSNERKVLKRINKYCPDLICKIYFDEVLESIEHLREFS